LACPAEWVFLGQPLIGGPVDRLLGDAFGKIIRQARRGHPRLTKCLASTTQVLQTFCNRGVLTQHLLDARTFIPAGRTVQMRRKEFVE
jgi:hypothetical protein